MKNLYLVFLSIFIFTCSDNSDSINQSQELSDYELIQLIKAADDKQEISLSEIPDLSQTTISETFEFSIVQSVYHAPNLGYEVNVQREGTRSLINLLAAINIYFNEYGELLSDNFENEYEEWDQNMCFDIEFPISINLNDGSVVTISNDEELYDGIEEYYEMDESNNLPEINFPINIIFYYENENGIESEELVEIGDYDELEIYFEMCEEEDFDDEVENWFEFDCIDLVYPIEIESPQGDNLSFEDEDSLITHIENWYENNPDNNQEFELVFPLTVIYFSESNDQIETLTISSDNELGEFIEENCIEDQNEEGEDDNDDNDEYDTFSEYTCGEVVFPILIEDPNGDVFSSDNEELLTEYIEQWFIDNDCNNVDCELEFEVVYPISITFENENQSITMTIQSEEMLNAMNQQYCED